MADKSDADVVTQAKGDAEFAKAANLQSYIVEAAK